MKPLSETEWREDGGMKVFSTFSGIGGFEIGIQGAFESYRKTQQANADSRHSSNDTGDSLQEWGQSATCVGYSEIDKYAIKVYEKQFPGVKNYGDIIKIKAEELPDFDCLVGGFPCQAFSIAGKRKGFEDTRGTLFFDLARILRAKQPRLFVFENVKGLLSHDSGRTFKTIIQTIDELGYDCQWQVLNSKNFGVPQNRERIYFIGHLRGECSGQVFPITSTNRTYNKKLERYATGTIKTRAGDSQNDNTFVATDTKEPRIRRLTPKECARLQGFPDDWCSELSDTQAYKCFGNAVTVNVVQAVFERIFNSLKEQN